MCYPILRQHIEENDDAIIECNNSQTGKIYDYQCFQNEK